MNIKQFICSNQQTLPPSSSHLYISRGFVAVGMNLLCCFEDTTVDSMVQTFVYHFQFALSQASQPKPKLPEGAIDICRKFDKDGNGFLSKSELKEAVGNSISAKELDDLMKEADTNHDGKVNYEGEPEKLHIPT